MTSLETKFKALFFFIFAAFGVFLPFVPLFFEALRLSKAQIGFLTMLPNFASFFVAPLFSMIGDSMNINSELMVLMLILSTVANFSMLYVSSFVQAFGIYIFASVFRSPVAPQIDSLVISTIADKAQYGSFRLWGAVSFGIFAFIGGLIIPNASGRDTGVSAHDSFQYIFFTNAFCNFIGGFIILVVVLQRYQLSAISPKHTDQELPGPSGSSTNNSNFKDVKTAGSGSPKKSRGVIGSLFDVFSAHPTAFLFATIVFLSGFGNGVIEVFLILRLKQLGGSGLIMGLARFITCAAEVPMFQIAGKLQFKYGTWAVLSATQLAFVVRFVYYSLLRIPWTVLPCEVLHGLTFATTWSVSCTYAHSISPPHCHSTMQALVEGVHFGFGSGMGSLIGGLIYDMYGAVLLFEFCALLSLLGLLLALFMWKVTPKEGFPEDINYEQTPISDAEDEVEIELFSPVKENRTQE